MATEVIHTIGVGGDYPSLSDWNAAQRRNLVALDEIAIAEITGRDVPHNLFLNGWTTSETNCIIIRAKAGEENNGVLGVGASTLGERMGIDEMHVHLLDLEFVTNGNNNKYSILHPNYGGRDYIHVERCIFHATNRYICAYLGGLNSTYRNNIFLYTGISSDCSVINTYASGSPVFENNTIIGFGTGAPLIKGVSTSPIFKNNVFVQLGDPSSPIVESGFTLGAGSTHNATSGTDPFGDNQIIGIVAGDFTDTSSNDYSIANDSVLAKAGTNPLITASDADDWKDITGKTRAYWDIGAFAAPASLAENTHLATFTTRPTDTGSSGGPNVAGTETNYPGYIDLSEAPQALWDAVTSGGGDIRVFENQAGGLVELPAEVVSCDTSAETGELHYLLPSISASTPQEIRLYADGVSSRYDHADPFGRNSVWGDEYFVYHLRDTEAGTTLKDSSGNQDATLINRLQGFTNSGVGGEFDGVNDIGTLGVSAPTGWTSGFSIRAAINPDGFSDNMYIFGGLNGPTGVGAILVTSGGNAAFYRYINSSLVGLTGNTALSAGTNYWIAGSAESGSGASVYLNGGEENTDTNAGSLTADSDSLFIAGRRSSNAQYFDGVIGFLRVGPHRPSNWITTEYNNQSDPSSFYTATDPNAGGGGDTEVTVDTVAFTFTAQPATIGASSPTNVDVDTQSFTFSPLAATVGFDVDVPVSAQAFTFSPKATSVSFNVNVEAGTQSFSFSALPATLLGEGGVSVGTKAFTFTALPATLYFDQNVNVGVENITFSSYKATIQGGVQRQVVKILGIDVTNIATIY
jgi:hypothetical protein